MMHFSIARQDTTHSFNAKTLTRVAVLRNKVTAVCLLALSCPLLATAQVYKCEDANGKPVFSDRPCGADAETVDVKVRSSGISVGPSGDFSRVREDMQRREIERKIARLDQDIEDLEDERDRRLDAIAKKREQANNNLAGATWEQSLATEMASVSQDYNARITAKRSEINRLRDRADR